MHDGFETRRARNPGAADFVEVKLLLPARLLRVEIDFAFFVNNSPNRLSIDLYDGKSWHSLLAETCVKHYRGNLLSLPVPLDMPVVHHVERNKTCTFFFSKLFSAGASQIGPVRRLQSPQVLRCRRRSTAPITQTKIIKSFFRSVDPKVLG